MLCINQILGNLCHHVKKKLSKSSFCIEKHSALLAFRLTRFTQNTRQDGKIPSQPWLLSLPVLPLWHTGLHLSLHAPWRTWNLATSHQAEEILQHICRTYTCTKQVIEIYSLNTWYTVFQGIRTYPSTFWRQFNPSMWRHFNLWKFWPPLQIAYNTHYCLPYSKPWNCEFPTKWRNPLIILSPR